MSGTVVMECAACTVTMIHKIGELNDNDNENIDYIGDNGDNGNIFGKSYVQRKGKSSSKINGP